MSGPALVFVLLPCLFAGLAGWLLTDWRLAAATLAGALALLLVMGPLLLPALSGIAVAALALIPLLLLRPAADLWSRLFATVAAAFVTHFALLLTQT